MAASCRQSYSTLSSRLLFVTCLVLDAVVIMGQSNSANETSFEQVNNIKTNITSSLAVSPDHKYFATLTRQLSRTSSQWIYRLQHYDYASQSKLESIDIYQSYDTDKHFLTFVPDSEGKTLIAVSTTNNLLFYTTGPLTQVANFLHQQQNVYDLAASPDGQLTVLVGQSIVMYRNNGFRRIIFPQVIQNARFCDFSQDGRYMTIASTGSLNVYTYSRSNDDYRFQQIPLASTSPVQYGAITSAEFNPNNSSEILVGFLSASPMFFSMELQSPDEDKPGGFFKKIYDIQPMSSENAKIAKFMPDGSRFYSYDFLNGIGLWPGASGKLAYKQKFLLYDSTANSDGTQLIGFVWESIKVVDINNICSDGSTAQTCSCASGQAWNYESYACQTLTCLQSEYATGVIQNNQCQCLSGYNFNKVARKCQIDCTVITHALTDQPSFYQCYCADNWSWNSLTRTCDFQCDKVPYSTGLPAGNGECGCLQGFVWSSAYNECVCPQYMEPSAGVCICLTNYYFDIPSGQCLVNCTLIPGATGTASNLQQCLCPSDSYYTIKNGQGGCQLNCSAIEDTVQQAADFGTCICHENMDWLERSCVPNCGKIEYSDPVPLDNNTCNCAINYIWINKIKECARDCSDVEYVIQGADSTLISCPCINHFEWSETNVRCEIQCDIIPNAEPYSLAQVNQCECRAGFNWNTQNYTCQVDCGSIWNAESRINDSHCNCAEGQPFDAQTLTCGSTESSGLFTNTLSIVGFIIGCIVVVIVMIILLRFCWKFATDRDPKQEKRLKGVTPKRVTKSDKLLKQQRVEPMIGDQLPTDQRLGTKKTVTTLE